MNTITAVMSRPFWKARGINKKSMQRREGCACGKPFGAELLRNGKRNREGSGEKRRLMEILTLALFCAMLLLCLLLDVSILWALAAGLLLFFLYGRRKGFSAREILHFYLSGVKTVQNILITFVLIGAMTALWRAAGTISMIVCCAVRLVRPQIFLLMTFLLNCAVSVLTGTSFGTAATMGVICSTMGASLGVAPILTGGAILSGIFFGDRCSPVSTSALLVATVTKTDIFQNVKRMLASAALPFVISCGVYALLGIRFAGTGTVPALAGIFAQELVLSGWTLLPAGVLFLLALCRVKVKLCMAASILTAIPICLVMQKTPAAALFSLLLRGYTAEHAEAAAMLNGGGIFSMVKVGTIVCLSSAYAGIFQRTPLLDGIRRTLGAVRERTTTAFAATLTAVFTSAIACNQTLAIMLTDQLCRTQEMDEKDFALTLEDTAVVIAPLIPWSIAGAVPLATVGAPGTSVFLACFLYLLPVCSCVRDARRKRKAKFC